MSILNKDLSESLIHSWNQVDPIYRNALFIVLLINILAFGQELVSFTMVWDDYNQIIWHESGKWINHGRWFLDAIYFFLLGGWYAPFLYTLLGITISTISALLICHLWNISKLFEVILVASSISTYPLMTDVYEWETNKVAIPLANLLAITSVWITRNKKGSILFGAIFIMLSLATYQTSVHFAIETIIFILLIKILTNKLDKENIKLILKKTLWPRIITIGLGGIFYIVSLKIAIQFQPELKSSRYGRLISSFWELRHKFNIQIEQALDLLFQSHDLFPFSLQLLTSTLFVAAAYNLTLIIFSRNESIFQRVIHFTVVLLIFVTALFSYQLIFIPSTSILQSYRTLSSFSVVMGALVTISTVFSRNTFERNGVFIASILLIFGFITQNNVEYTRRYFINLHDWHLANRILTRIETHPDFEKALSKHQIAMIGLPTFLGDLKLLQQEKSSLYLEKPPSSMHMAVIDFILSIYFENYTVIRVVPWRKNSLNFVPKSAIDYACNHNSWPHPDSIKILNDGLIVISFLNYSNNNKICTLHKDYL